MTSDAPIVDPAKEFNKRNQKSYARSVELARLAKDKLIQDGVKDITEEVFREYTKKVDSEGKGICHDTVYKNEEVHEIFMSLSPVCQKRLIQVKKATRKSKKPCPLPKVISVYQGLRRYELIRVIEKQKKEIIELNINLLNIRKERHQLEEQNKKQALYILQKLSENLSSQEVN